MRTIKFRAWDKKDKVMHADVHMGIMFEDGSHYRFERFLGHQEPDDYHEWVLMQYTGLKDRTGREIFESDIVRTEVITNKKKNITKQLEVIVEWDDRLAKFKPRTLHKGHWEIVGNKFENV